MLGGPEGMIILVIVLVLFGGSQLPKLARNLGRAQKEFKDGLSEAAKDDTGVTAPAKDDTGVAEPAKSDATAPGEAEGAD